MSRSASGVLFGALLLGLTLARPAAAQVYGSLAFSVAAPQNEFRSELGATGYGLSLGALYQFPHLPIAVGLDASGMIYGHTRRRVPFSYDVPEVGLDVTTDNSVAQALAVVRLHPVRGAVRPYAEALGGVNYLFTSSAVRSTNGDEAFASTTNYDDVALTAGGGAGVLVSLYSAAGRTGKHNGPAEILLDARVRYLVGAEATYLGRGDLTTEDGELHVDPRHSRTDLLLPQLGVTLRF